MKKILSFLVALAMSALLFACGAEADYKNAESFESALNAEEDLTGKIVTVEVNDYKPDSTFGFNLCAGEHLNFCSNSEPKARIGDEITVKVTSVKKFMNSYIIYYEEV